MKLVSPSVLFNDIQNMPVDIRSNEKLPQLKAAEPHSLNISTQLLHVYKRGKFILCFCDRVMLSKNMHSCSSCQSDLWDIKSKLRAEEVLQTH